MLLSPGALVSTVHGFSAYSALPGFNAVRDCSTKSGIQLRYHIHTVCSRSSSSRVLGTSTVRKSLGLHMGIDIPLGKPSEGSASKGEPFDVLLANLAFSNPRDLPKIVETNFPSLDDDFFACKSI